MVNAPFGQTLPCWKVVQAGKPLDIVPTKVSFFAWEVWCGKVLTMEQLKKRGFQLASMCSLCGRAEKILIIFYFLGNLEGEE